MSILKHKTIEQRSIQVFDKYVENHNGKILDISSMKKAEFGLYFLFLSYIHNLTLEQCKDIIIDTEFCDKVEDASNNDLGVDAIYIDEDTCEIFLYTFKYKHSFNDGEQGENPYYIAQKFIDELTYLLSVDVDNDGLEKYTYKTRGFLARIQEIIKTTFETYDIYLYQVSNQANPPQKINSIRKIKSDVSILSDIDAYTLPDIYNLLFRDRKEINSKMEVNYNQQLSYEADSASTIKHYAISLPLIDLVSITCNDPKIRESGLSEEFDNVELEINILYDNVRGYILKSSYNGDMLETLEKIPENFFIFNNGITIVVDSMNVTPNKLKKSLIFNLEKMQIVNGGQTLRTIYKYIQENPETWQEQLYMANILVKIVDTSSNTKISSEVAKYTNSQNPVSPYDLKSMDSLQIAIEEFMEGKNIRYIRKNGDIGIISKSYEIEMDMITLGQLIFSKQGNPHRASSSKKQIFKKYYDDVFKDDSILIDAYELTKLFYEIKNLYEKLDVLFTEQKSFYIVYAYYKVSDPEIDNLINDLEDALEKYTTKKELSAARKLLLVGFKDYFDSFCKIKE